LVSRSLAGKVAIVTGSGRGIGKGIALRLAAEGARMVATDVDPDAARVTSKEIQAQGGTSLAREANVADLSAVSRLVEDVVAELGRIDILVNNAGVMQTKPMLDLTEADWDRVIEVNQRGLFFALQAVAVQMVRQVPEEVKQAGRADRSYGKIVNIASISARRGRPLATHYAAAKAGVVSITQSAALALAPYNINVNAVCPGIVLTPMWEEIDRQREELFGTKPGEATASFIKTVPLQREGTPDDIAAAVAFLCSPDADYITGQALNVDGGYEMD
jgi:NAD(P)-dependent dehydrogenase (short-subunit alcohol dehydrogenase family)